MNEDTQNNINKDVQKDIDQLYDHADIANKEMGEVKEHLALMSTNIAVITNDQKWMGGDIKMFKEEMEEKMEKLDSRVWYILATVIIGILMQIVLKVK